MKIIINVVLLALFVSGNAYSADIKSLKHICTTLEENIINSYVVHKKFLVNTTEHKFYKDSYMESAKIYHYLDCSDFR